MRKVKDDIAITKSNAYFSIGIGALMRQSQVNVEKRKA
jgi:hypothetical protein